RPSRRRPSIISTSWRAATGRTSSRRRCTRTTPPWRTTAATARSGPRSELLQDRRGLEPDLVRAGLGENLHRELLRMIAGGLAEKTRRRGVIHRVQLRDDRRAEGRVELERRQRAPDRLGPHGGIVVMEPGLEELRERRRSRAERVREHAVDRDR